MTTSNPAKLDLRDRLAVQRELKQGGFYAGAIDGSWGPKSEAAWQTALAAHRVGPILPDTSLSDAVRAEFVRLWALAEILPEHRVEVYATARSLSMGRARYEAVQATTKVPWFVIGLIHGRECSFRFDQHLHNGDPLAARTVHVPAGRPLTGRPPFAWAYSAADALAYDHFTTWADWSVSGLLYKLEGYNGWGYRKHGRPSSYLFNFTAAGMPGKYVADGVWDPAAVDREPGCAAVLKMLVEVGAVAL